jgi:hypothetical protein
VTGWIALSGVRRSHGSVRLSCPTFTNRRKSWREHNTWASLTLTKKGAAFPFVPHSEEVSSVSVTIVCYVYTLRSTNGAMSIFSLIRCLSVPWNKQATARHRRISSSDRLGRAYANDSQGVRCTALRLTGQMLQSNDSSVSFKPLQTHMLTQF